jgi:hypothetical protein
MRKSNQMRALLIAGAYHARGHDLTKHVNGRNRDINISGADLDIDMVIAPSTNPDGGRQGATYR